MEDTTRLTSDASIKLFIQRDYSEGTAVKFQERFPSELENKGVSVVLPYGMNAHFQFRSAERNSKASYMI